MITCCRNNAQSRDAYDRIGFDRIKYDRIGMLTWVVAVHYLRGLLDEPDDVCGDVRDTYSLHIQYSHHPPHR